ncbi:MAG: response regulator [Actinomycetota bacterium]|nr:response regulator [Actinomycetota bacterium]
MPEHRKQGRVRLDRPVQLNGCIKVTGLDLSEGGLYVHTGRNFPKGSIIQISIEFDRGLFKAAARVQHSEPGVGMGLQFLELDQNQTAMIREFLDLSKNQPQDGSGKKKVLILDEAPGSSNKYKSRLVLEGYSVFETADCDSALQHLASEGADLLLIDPYMKQTDGFEFLARLRAIPALEAVPFLVLASRSVPADMEKARGLGALGFAAKSTFSPVKLAERVKAIIKP